MKKESKRELLHQRQAGRRKMRQVHRSVFKMPATKDARLMKLIGVFELISKIEGLEVLKG